MQPLDLVGYTADLAHLVMVDPSTGERFKAPLSDVLIATIVEVLQSAEDEERLAQLGAASLGPVRLQLPSGLADPGLDLDAPSPAAALVSLGRTVAGATPRARIDGSASRLTPSEIQRLLRSGKTPESVAEQANVSLDWVLRWFQPIAAEQRKVITSVRGGRQERAGFGLSQDLIGDAVRTNLLSRDVEPDGEGLSWTAARPEGRPYWTVTLRFNEASRVQRATWRYDIGTGRVSPRDDLAIDLGWTAPITHPTPGRMHHSTPQAPATPPAAAGPPPPAAAVPSRWSPPAPPARRRHR